MPRTKVHGLRRVSRSGDIAREVEAAGGHEPSVNLEVTPIALTLAAAIMLPPAAGQSRGCALAIFSARRRLAPEPVMSSLA